MPRQSIGGVNHHSSDDDDDYDGSNDGRNGVNGGRGKKSKYMKRDTNKIKTNPKYKCVDEGSEDETTIMAKSNMNEDGAQSSKEM
jgi:hypothetical protein